MFLLIFSDSSLRDKKVFTQILKKDLFIMFNLILLISSLVFMALGVYLFTNVIFSNDNDLLDWESDEDSNSAPSGIIKISRPLVRNFTIQHAQKVKNEDYRKRVEKKILVAGLSRVLSVDEFIGMQILWGLILPAFISILNFSLQLDFSYIFCICLGLFGLYMPHLYCQQHRQKRHASIIVDLPFFIDLLALSTEAGLDFIGAIQRIVDKAKGSVLASEFATVLKDLKLGSSRTDALRAMDRRIDIPEVTRFSAVIIDASETGASVGTVLKDQSIQMRLERLIRAEKAGAKASQAMLIPMMIFIMPAVFIMVFSPIALQFFYGGN